MVPPDREDELIEHHESNLKAWDEGRAFCFTIETKDPVEFIGRITIRKQKEPNVWDLGFWTHPKQQNNGYMTEAVLALLTFGFERLTASKIVACHALWNKPSEVLLKKVGMEFMEYLPQGFFKDGRRVDENRLGITQKQWISKQQVDPIWTTPADSADT